jgi:hypothetical protein
VVVAVVRELLVQMLLAAHQKAVTAVRVQVQALRVHQQPMLAAVGVGLREITIPAHHQAVLAVEVVELTVLVQQALQIQVAAAGAVDQQAVQVDRV